MSKIIIFSALIFSSIAHVYANDSAQEIMAISKFAGACGILQSQSAFQDATKMPGGDDFIKRYWSTEASRLGKTPEQYISDCNKYISSYTKVLDGLNEAKK